MLVLFLLIIKLMRYSVTPMKANFWQTSHHLHGTELLL